MKKLLKEVITSKEQLDTQMHSLIGGSWDYHKDKYPKKYPCLLVMDDPSRSIWDFIYPEEVLPQEILFVSRFDLIERNKNKNIKELEIADFNIRMSCFDSASVVIFIDDNGITRILKTRY